jgi:hypothetical protein
MKMDDDEKLEYPAIASEDALRDSSKKHNATVIDGKSEYALAWRTCLEWVQSKYILRIKTTGKKTRE